MVAGIYVNGRGPFEMMADSGAPDLWFTVGDLPKLGIKKSSLEFKPMEGEGLVAWVTLPEVRIGDFVAHSIDAAITQRQLPESRLLGMSILKQGHVEVAGDTCTLTFPHNAARPGRIAASIKPGRPQ
jgi:clan AA aspartic protease (TIGR02281 family)